ncbi:L,D-transpeptidase [Actinokineospora terrae]|uniref:Lipoprotein-anchoring transpeptidase ErfK/SrfK n=1 Tax=Actinokineospora terrae TaxID=155974 RepID=A0A1H9UTH2_9PSEU|nr:L,D-transpeptidase [Actinokineospora terrae]SES12323.1 Lipoprotein-anchoring transpeptidase ErfK/SrfK [Actinokineospora terrae]
MKVNRLIAGAVVAAAALLATACGTGDAAPAAQQVQAATTTTTTTVAPTTTTTTTTAAPTTTTTTVAPPVTTTTTKKKPPVTTTTTKKPKPSTTAKPAPAPVEGVPCAATVSACIDLSANQSWLLKDGKVVLGPVPITHGRAGYRTPVGTFKVGWKDIDHKSREFNDAPMPFSVFFNGGIAFHQGSLKVPSHGCIHLSASAAKAYFNGLSVGDTVQVVA